ncbi:MAG: amidohydrolase family protein [Chloroflexi bacterium]|nr:amidohydrolase family protein [Chloroflexota bacterium]
MSKVVDFHTHVFPPEVVADRARFRERDPFFAALYANPRAKLATAEDCVAAMDVAGVDLAVALGFGWTDSALCAMHNDYLADAQRRFPDRLVGFATVFPPDGGRAADELGRAAAAGLRGVGELMPHGQGYRLDDERAVGSTVEAALALGLPLLIHASEPVGHAYSGKGDVDLASIERFLRRWPAPRVILAHWGGGLPFYELMPEVAEVTRRVCYDSAATPFLYRTEVFPIVARLVGAERVLFGSDYPLIRPGPQIQKIRASGLSAEAVEAILGGNALRLLRHSPG